MSSIKLEIVAENVADLSSTLADLGALVGTVSGSPAPAATRSAKAGKPAVDAAQTSNASTAASTATPASAAPATEVAPANPTAAAAPIVEPTTAAAPTASSTTPAAAASATSATPATAASGEVTFETLKATLTTVLSKKSASIAQSVLKSKFGVGAISALKAEQYGAANAALEEALK